MNYERIIRLSLALVIAATTITASAVLVSAQEATKPEAPAKQATEGRPRSIQEIPAPGEAG